MHDYDVDEVIYLNCETWDRGLGMGQYNFFLNSEYAIR